MRKFAALVVLAALPFAADRRRFARQRLLRPRLGIRHRTAAAAGAPGRTPPPNPARPTRRCKRSRAAPSNSRAIGSPARQTGSRKIIRRCRSIVANGRAGDPNAHACSLCHYPNGKGRPENASVSGLPVSYFMQQLEDFRNDLRKSAEPRKANYGAHGR